MVQIRRLAQQDLDWNDLVRTAQWHHVTPLLYWQLKAVCPEFVPTEILSKLASNFKINVQRNLFLTAQLIKLLKVFSAHHIFVLPFKGSVLSAKIYKNIALRKFYDIDLLIHPQDFFLAKKILNSQGYQPLKKLNPKQEELRVKTNYECEFIHKNSTISIDLHWQFAPPYFSFPLQPAAILERSETLELAGNQLTTFSSDDLLFVLCVNGCKDGWLSLQRICDVAEFIRSHPQLEWNKLLDRAEQLQCLRMLLLGLKLASDLLGSPLPDRVRHQIETDPTIEKLASQVYQRLLEGVDVYPTRLQLAYFSLLLQQGLFAKARYCWGLIFPINERDLEFIALPSFLFPLYYPLRLLRLLLKYGLHCQTER